MLLILLINISCIFLFYLHLNKQSNRITDTIKITNDQNTKNYYNDNNYNKTRNNPQLIYLLNNTVETIYEIPTVSMNKIKGIFFIAHACTHSGLSY